MKWLILAVAVLAVGLLATRDLWWGEKAEAPAPSSPPPIRSAAACDAVSGFEGATTVNADSLRSLIWSPFGVEERGWDAYAPTIMREIGSDCGPDTAAFASALTDWQKANGLAPSGQLTAETFEKMRIAWMLRRPFVVATRTGTCPAGPDEASLRPADPAMGYHGKAVILHPRALDAHRRLLNAARREEPAVAEDPNLLTLVSGYRSPAENAARCAEKGCGGPARARCSAHQTGMALDLNLGSIAGSDPTSSSDANRSWQASTPAYLWLVRNAERFGFVPYPYEPWHWEWAGDSAG